MGASVDLDELLLKLKWTEEGAQIPDRARAQLAKLREEQERLARTPVAPALGPGGAIGGRNAFQAGWATQSQILQTMQRDAGRATTAVTQLGSATGSAGAATVGAATVGAATRQRDQRAKRSRPSHRRTGRRSRTTRTAS